jgi:DNA-binding NarL/FixJ family response regulator
MIQSQTNIGIVPYGRAWQDQFEPNHQSAPDIGLTERECTVLQLLCHGLSNKEAAVKLGISPETVKSHVKNIFDKLRVDRRAQAVSRGLTMGVITAA